MSEPTAAILGDSAPMQALRAYLPKVGRSGAPVLITGETGTGKECVARTVHALSQRAGQPFIPINCAALPEGLLESELFGHERGAFTGAHSASKGLIAAASGGTLFLDEIGEMSGFAQAKLLRALESGEVQPVGAVRPIKVDFRIIAATNQHIETMMERQHFRADLYYRLNVARLHLAPLRERPTDVPVLLQAAVGELNARHGLRVGRPAGDLLGCLLAHGWPGNVRELRNLVEGIFIDPPDGAIHFEHLPPAARVLLQPYRQTNLVERDRLVEVLRATKWNKAEAAKALKCSRMTLYRKLARYHVEQVQAPRHHPGQRATAAAMDASTDFCGRLVAPSDEADVLEPDNAPLDEAVFSSGRV